MRGTITCSSEMHGSNYSNGVSEIGARVNERSVKMHKGDYLFVYGTLRRGESSDLSRNHLQVDYIGEDKINGELFNLGWYAGVRDATDDEIKSFDPEGHVVVGDVFRIRDQGIVPHLDAYEGYPTLYNRVRVKTERDRTVWVYTYNPATAPDRLIPSGDWKTVIKPEM